MLFYKFIWPSCCGWHFITGSIPFFISWFQFPLWKTTLTLTFQRTHCLCKFLPPSVSLQSFSKMLTRVTQLPSLGPCLESPWMTKMILNSQPIRKGEWGSTSAPCLAIFPHQISSYRYVCNIGVYISKSEQLLGCIYPSIYLSIDLSKIDNRS